MKKYIKESRQQMLNEYLNCPAGANCPGGRSGEPCSVSVGGNTYGGNWDCDQCSCLDRQGNCLFGDCNGSYQYSGGVLPTNVMAKDVKTKEKEVTPTLDPMDMMMREAVKNIIKKND